MPEESRANVGWLVKERRKEMGLSQEELARRLGMKREYLSQIESGKPKWPQKYIGDIARELGVSPISLALAAGKIEKPGVDDLVAREHGEDAPLKAASFIAEAILDIRLQKHYADQCLDYPSIFPLHSVKELHQAIEETKRKYGISAEIINEDGEEIEITLRVPTSLPDITR